mgnify:CR=1 FL=1
MTLQKFLVMAVLIQPDMICMLPLNSQLLLHHIPPQKSVQDSQWNCRKDTSELSLLVVD